MSGQLDWLEGMIDAFPEKSDLSGHIFDAVWDDKINKIVCTVDSNLLENLHQELKQLIEYGSVLSTLQFIFVYFTAVFRAEAVLQNMPANIFKRIQVNLENLESIMVKKNGFSECKHEPRYQVFKEKNVSIFKNLAFKDFSTESVAFEKSIGENLNEKRVELALVKEKLEILETLLKDSIQQIEAAVSQSFVLVPNKLIFRYNDFHTLHMVSHSSLLPVLQRDPEVKTVIENQLFFAMFYLTDTEYERLQKAIENLPEELQQIILSLVISAEDEHIYNSKKKHEELKNLGVFACQRDGRLFLNSFYKYKIKFAHVKEIRGYLKAYDDEAVYNVICCLMTSFMIPVTNDQLEIIKKVQKVHALESVREALAESEVHVLNEENRAQLDSKIEHIFKVNEKAFVKFYEAFEKKQDLLQKIDILNDKVTFELLALEFFGIFK